MTIQSKGSLLVRLVATFLGLLWCSYSWAGFTGSYDISNWTVSASSFGCGTSSVDTSGAPGTVTFTVANGCASSFARITLPSMPSSGTVTFNYSISGAGSGHIGQTIVNGTSTTFATFNGATVAGTATVNATSGQSFAIDLSKFSGFGSTTMTITNFSVAAATNSTSVPTLTEMGLFILSIILVFFTARRLRER